MFRKSSSISINTQETGAVTNATSDIRERFFEVKHDINDVKTGGHEFVDLLLTR